MPGMLPATPMDALSISGPLRAAVKIIHTCADIFKFWKFPLQNLPGDFEEWSLMQKMYWGYKSKKPVTRAEKGSQLEAFFKNNRSFHPPHGFQPQHTVTLGAVGDLIKVDGLENSGDSLYEHVEDLIFKKDISLANLESQLTSQDTGAIIFSDKDTPPLCLTESQYETVKGHKGKNFTLVHTACNHTFDMGLEGLETTLAQLEKDGITDLGTNRTPDRQPQGRIMEKNGIKIGFVSTTFGLNGKQVPEGKDYMVNVVKFHRPGPDGYNADLSLLERQIEYCKQQQCDIILASLHWGYEYEFFPRQHQVDMAHRIVEMGADAIISHHAHVIQPMECYRPQRDPNRTAVIAYSLGNLTYSFSAPHLVLSAALDLTISKGTIGGEEKTMITGARLIPLVQVETHREGKRVLQVLPLETYIDMAGGDENERVSSIRSYVDLVIGK